MKFRIQIEATAFC